MLSLWCNKEQLISFQAFSISADKSVQVGYFSMADAFTDLVPIGILGGDPVSGVVPVLVVNSLQVPSVLSVQSPWPNSDNSSSI